MKSILIVIFGLSLVVVCALLLQAKQTSLAYAQALADTKEVLTERIDQCVQLEIDKESRSKLLETLTEKQRQLQSRMRLHLAELAAANEALRLESTHAHKAVLALKAAKHETADLRVALVESERLLKANSQAGKIAQMKERIQKLETTNLQLVATLQKQAPDNPYELK